MGVGCQRNQTYDLRVGTLKPLGREDGLGIKLIINGQRFNQFCPHNGKSIKSLNEEIWRTSRLLNTLRCWDIGTLGGHGNTTLLPRNLAIRFSIWLFLNCILYNKLLIVSAMLFWVLWALIANYPTQGGGLGNLRFITGESSVQETQTCDWHLKWEAVFWDLTLNLGVVGGLSDSG